MFNKTQSPQNDYLIDGKTGFLVELGDRKKFTEKVVELMKISELHSRISAYNKKLVQGYYISQCAGKYIQVQDQILRAVFAVANNAQAGIQVMRTTGSTEASAMKTKMKNNKVDRLLSLWYNGEKRC